MGVTDLAAGQVITAATLNSRLQVGTFAAGSNANNTTETSVGQVTIPANDAASGSIYHCVIKGQCTSGAVANGYTVRCRFDSASGTTILGGFASTPGAINTTLGWYIDMYLACIIGGSAGAWDVWGTLFTQVPTPNIARPGVTFPGLVGVHDCTVPIPIVVTSTWSATSTGQTSSANIGFLERIA